MVIRKSAPKPTLSSDERGATFVTEGKQLDEHASNSRNLFDDSNKENAAWLIFVKDLLRRKR